MAVLVKGQATVGVDGVGAASSDGRLGTSSSQSGVLDVVAFVFRVGLVDGVEAGLLLEGAGAAAAVVAAARLCGREDG